MISQCANPDCRAPFLYFHEGRLIAVDHTHPHTPKIEFFWLCADCATRFRYELAVDGSMHLVPSGSEPGPGSPA